MERELNCKHCDRYLGKAIGSVVAEIKCSNTSCKATSQFKIVVNDLAHDIKAKFLTPEQPPKTAKPKETVDV